MNTREIRQKFLDFFKSKQHTIVPSSSLVPGNDPTLLFTNAGMVQFKDVFLGDDKRSYTRATSSQRCVRAGGKHNDLENVGFTARHHTFFEMLGNFSFGDYFKREAIQFAWEFITQELKLPAEKLWVTVFTDDDEAADIWLNEIKVDPARLSRCGMADNFWSMGDTGPCGPCSEIFYDHGPDVAGGPPGTPDADGDRYIEIWNLVFMQFDRDASGNMEPLPAPSVDTGMGLERIAAIMQGVHSNYEIDLFQNIINGIAALTHTTDLKHKSLRVIADHLRACSFLITDGVLPSNDGRGYVLRRILRRAIRHGRKLGVEDLFFHNLIPLVVKEMGDAYPELVAKQEHIVKVCKQEEEQFAKTIEHGLRLFNDEVEDMVGKIIPGHTVFKLYDTYGFPVDLTADIARERGLQLDMPGFEAEMQAQKEKARAANKFALQTKLKTATVTTFLGYKQPSAAANVTELFVKDQKVKKVSVGQEAVIILDQTPCYAESGGQVGDTGIITAPNGFEFTVLDTQKNHDAIAHLGIVENGELEVNADVSVEIDLARRQSIMANHSATHLMHAALRNILGTHVQQKGSVVDAERLRFDFSHPQPLTYAEIQAIENLVNREIRVNSAVRTEVMAQEEAKARGAMALFGEKYGDKVRVLTMGDDFSIELCGGTHVSNTGDIGAFAIASETGISSGVRRIEGITGQAVVDFWQRQHQVVNSLCARLKANQPDLVEKVEFLLNKNKTLEKDKQILLTELASGKSKDLAADARDIKGIKVIAAELPGGDPKSLREAVDRFKNQLKTAVIVLAVVNEDKISLISGVTRDCTAKIKAGDVVNFVAQQVGGKGGGRPDMAQAGGDQPEKLPAALESVFPWLEEQL